MLEKKIELGLITILQGGEMQVREDTVIYENLVEISRTYNRYVSNPGDDLEGKPQRVRDVAGVVWTPEVIEAYIEKKKKNLLPEIPPPAGPLQPEAPRPTILMPPDKLVTEN
jgi:hypothetical protein